MIDGIIKADREYGLFDGVKDITVAVSGGADSVALLYGLFDLSESYGFSLTVAHYHHGIRGDEADRDLLFVEKLADSLGLPFVFDRGNAVAYAEENGLSIETAARELRYAFLTRVARGVIATAHTASDNIETVLFNMIRGTSLSGVRGIPAKRDNIIRPLILCDRECIEKYCDDNNLLYVTDSTNFIDDCSRNIIRHSVIPVLRRINPAAVRNVSNLSRTLTSDNSLIDSIVEPEFNSRFAGGSLDITGFDTLHPSIAKRLIIRLYKDTFGVLPDGYHIEKILEVASGAIVRTSVHRGKSAVRSGNFLFFDDTEKTDREFSVKRSIISIEDFKKIRDVHHLLTINVLDCDKINGEVEMIPKNNADLIRLAGSRVTKTVKKLMTEKKIPIEYRTNLPVLADADGIIWIYGVGVADRVKIGKSTKSVLCIEPTVL